MRTPHSRQREQHIRREGRRLRDQKKERRAKIENRMEEERRLARAEEKEVAREIDMMSKHHILPRCRQGEDYPSNLLRMWFYKKHQNWHLLFGDRTIEEAIQLLERVDRAVKHRNSRR